MKGVLRKQHTFILGPLKEGAKNNRYKPCKKGAYSQRTNCIMEEKL